MKRPNNAGAWTYGMPRSAEARPPLAGDPRALLSDARPDARRHRRRSSALRPARRPQLQPSPRRPGRRGDAAGRGARHQHRHLLDAARPVGVPARSADAGDARIRFQRPPPRRARERRIPGQGRAGPLRPRTLSRPRLRDRARVQEILHGRMDRRARPERAGCDAPLHRAHAPMSPRRCCDDAAISSPDRAGAVRARVRRQRRAAPARRRERPGASRPAAVRSSSFIASRRAPHQPGAARRGQQPRLFDVGPRRRSCRGGARCDAIVAAMRERFGRMSCSCRCHRSAGRAARRGCAAACRRSPRPSRRRRRARDRAPPTRWPRRCAAVEIDLRNCDVESVADPQPDPVVDPVLAGDDVDRALVVRRCRRSTVRPTGASIRNWSASFRWPAAMLCFAPPAPSSTTAMAPLRPIIARSGAAHFSPRRSPPTASSTASRAASISCCRSRRSTPRGVRPVPGRQGRRRAAIPATAR